MYANQKPFTLHSKIVTEDHSVVRHPRKKSTEVLDRPAGKPQTPFFDQILKETTNQNQHYQRYVDILKNDSDGHREMLMLKKKKRDVSYSNINRKHEGNDVDSHFEKIDLRRERSRELQSNRSHTPVNQRPLNFKNQESNHGQSCKSQKKHKTDIFVDNKMPVSLSQPNLSNPNVLVGPTHDDLSRQSSRSTTHINRKHPVQELQQKRSNDIWTFDNRNLNEVSELTNMNLKNKRSNVNIFKQKQVENKENTENVHKSDKLERKNSREFGLKLESNNSNYSHLNQNQ
eukprot:CAMPEP_0116952650 /NCGR_PEP_ID=MMETSP0467-20121206/40871_1 /TAXON_ID=283647 /ORGANISM="Mesodinium pulex, Strain SPMC105" /LENGTH=286 /DNA_ID=CAMNT_0004637987 /DNA_START=45 /DNA_END=905 /DNA_ORIENTATION=+